jgi:hypothetical protein
MSFFIPSGSLAYFLTCVCVCVCVYVCVCVCVQARARAHVCRMRGER